MGQVLKGILRKQEASGHAAILEAFLQRQALQGRAIKMERLHNFPVDPAALVEDGILEPRTPFEDLNHLSCGQLVARRQVEKLQIEWRQIALPTKR